MYNYKFLVWFEFTTESRSKIAKTFIESLNISSPTLSSGKFMITISSKEEADAGVIKAIGNSIKEWLSTEAGVNKNMIQIRLSE